MKSEPDKIIGLMLGTALGDALGLPREGLSPRRAAAMYGTDFQHRFLFGRGMCSDDTEHAIFTAQALVASRGDETAFAKELASRFRWWMVRMPAGIGWATLRAGAKLWLGFSPENSGVFSAGNGPAMRAPILGAFAADDLTKLKTLIRVSTRLTHTDQKAEQGALAIALCARRAMLDGPALSRDKLFGELYCEIECPDLSSRLKRVEDALASEKTTEEFASQLSGTRGVSGYIYETVPAAIFCWLNSLSDFRVAVTDVIRLGGDADTTGAIVGALSGATLGQDAIPKEWIKGLAEWPHSVQWITDLCERLGDPTNRSKDRRFLGGVCILIRNVPFMLIVIGHGFRRLFPPY
ncbi:MAG: ADP-ribosylglycohydrolase family protein [Planctomycetota bacterium]